MYNNKTFYQINVMFILQSNGLIFNIMQVSLVNLNFNVHYKGPDVHDIKLLEKIYENFFKKMYLLP